MAKLKIITEAVLLPLELVKYIEDYWKNQPNGLVVWSGKKTFFNLLPIAQWLQTTANITATEEEIFEANKILLMEWARTKTGIAYMDIHYGEMDEPHTFEVSFKIVPVSPSEKQNCVPV